jgi:hypothetical protein
MKLELTDDQALVLFEWLGAQGGDLTRALRCLQRQNLTIAGS